MNRVRSGPARAGRPRGHSGEGTLRDQKVDEAFAVLAYFTLHPLREIGERCALGLAHIEDVGRTKADEYGPVLLGNVLLGLAALLVRIPIMGARIRMITFKSEVNRQTVSWEGMNCGSPNGSP